MEENVNKIAESNDYKNLVEKGVDAQSQQDLDNFKKYYENATDEEKKELNKKFEMYFNEELENDSILKNQIAGSETVSSEVAEQDINDPEVRKSDIENLKTVRNLTDVLNDYPNISSPEYRAVKKIIDEHIEDLSRETEEVLANPENKEGKNVDNHN